MSDCSCLLLCIHTLQYSFMSRSNTRSGYCPKLSKNSPCPHSSKNMQIQCFPGCVDGSVLTTITSGHHESKIFGSVSDEYVLWKMLQCLRKTWLMVRVFILGRLMLPFYPFSWFLIFVEYLVWTIFFLFAGSVLDGIRFIFVG